MFVKGSKQNAVSMYWLGGRGNVERQASSAVVAYRLGHDADVLCLCRQWRDAAHWKMRDVPRGGCGRFRSAEETTNVQKRPRLC